MARRDTFAAVTFGYVGYVWAIFGCASVALFFGGLAGALYVIGRRAERRAPRTTVQSLTSPSSHDAR